MDGVLLPKAVLGGQPSEAGARTVVLWTGLERSPQLGRVRGAPPGDAGERAPWVLGVATFVASAVWTVRSAARRGGAADDAVTGAA